MVRGKDQKMVQRCQKWFTVQGHLCKSTRGYGQALTAPGLTNHSASFCCLSLLHFITPIAAGYYLTGVAF